MFVLIFGVSTQQYNWLGSYSYESDNRKPGVAVIEQLVVENYNNRGFNYRWTYDVRGYRTFYILKGYAVNKGAYTDFYISELSDGEYNQFEYIDKSRPFFKLAYQQGRVLTKWIQPQSQKNFRPYFTPD